MSGAAPVDAAPAAGRWLALDALRGLSIAAMILVNNPGRWGEQWQYAPLRHAAWHGCTPTDLVFPTFLFCAGVAIVPAFQGRLAAGAPRGPLVARIGWRVLCLVLLGMLLSAFPLITFAEGSHLFEPLLRTRFPGVLQRIGVCYGLAALLFLFARVPLQRAVLLLCLSGAFALATLVPVPVAAATVDATVVLRAQDLGDPMATLHGFVDRLVFGDHIWVKGSYDPEGLLGTIPALATCLFGVEAGRLLRAPRPALAKARALVGGGGVLMVVGWVWSFWLPLNKPLWTSSYAVWTAGIAAVLLGAFVWAIDVRGWRRLVHPLQVYGVNALLVFVGSGLLGRIVGRLIEVPLGDTTVSLQQWFFRQALASWAEPKVASLLFALLWVGGWYLVLAALFRRGLVWKV